MSAPLPAHADVAARPGWRGRLALRYERAGAHVAGEAPRTAAHFVHEGPLRVLQPLYPEGPSICQHVIVHPPGGVVGGDRLEIEVEVGEGAAALLTTPGATRFYRSGGRPAAQAVHLRLARDARLEWLPLEAIAHPGCEATSRLAFELAPGAQLIGWDLVALGLPASGQAFEREPGRFEQDLRWLDTPAVHGGPSRARWIERGRIDARDRVLLDGAPGLAGRRVFGTAWIATGALPPAAGPGADRAAEAWAAPLLEAAREAIDAAPLVAGATSPQPQLVVVRVLAGRVEPALALLASVRARWRQAAWGLEPVAPRIWRT